MPQRAPGSAPARQQPPWREAASPPRAGRRARPLAAISCRASPCLVHVLLPLLPLLPSAGAAAAARFLCSSQSVLVAYYTRPPLSPADLRRAAPDLRRGRPRGCPQAARAAAAPRGASRPRAGAAARCFPQRAAQGLFRPPRRRRARASAAARSAAGRGSRGRARSRRRGRRGLRRRIRTAGGQRTGRRGKSCTGHRRLPAPRRRERAPAALKAMAPLDTPGEMQYQQQEFRNEKGRHGWLNNLTKRVVSAQRWLQHCSCSNTKRERPRTGCSFR